MQVQCPNESAEFARDRILRTIFKKLLFHSFSQMTFGSSRKSETKVVSQWSNSAEGGREGFKVCNHATETESHISVAENAFKGHSRSSHIL